MVGIVRVKANVAQPTNCQTMSAEELPAQKIDRCITDAIVKFGSGILVGGVFSLLFFRRRKWPVIMGAGVGLGMAYNNCEVSLNRLYVSGDRVDPDTGELFLAKK